MLKDCQKSLCALFALTAATLALISCSAKQGELFYGALGAGEPRIVTTTNVAGIYTVQIYNLDGGLIKVLSDFTSSAQSPRGIAPIDFFEFAIALDGTDQLQRISLTGAATSLVNNSSLTGNLYQMRRSPAGEFFVIESNTVESFSATGVRVGNTRINATVGSCVLNIPRGLDFNQDGNLVVVGTGNDDLNVYDISNSSSSCVTANTSFGNVDPIAVLAHSNGLLYVATQGDDRVYSFAGDGSGTATTVFNNAAVVLNPTALIELPDGSILVASDGTNAIVKIDAAGTVLDATFIADGFTGLVSDMALMPGDE